MIHIVRHLQLLFSFLTCVAEPSLRLAIFTYVDIMLLFNLLDEVSHHLVININTAQILISCASFHMELSTLNPQNGNIKSATSKIVDETELFGGAWFVDAIRNGCSSGLSDDLVTVQASYLAGI